MSRYLTSSALALVFAIAPASLATAQQTSTAPQNFSDLDVSGDQQLDRSEFEQVSDERFGAWDADRNDRISNTELSRGMYVDWDRDSNGSLTKEEYRAGAQAWLGDNYPRFEDIDQDNNDSLMSQEFSSAIQDSDAFSEWNADGDGLDREAFNTALFDAYDTDGNDQLSQRDYEAIVIIATADLSSDGTTGTSASGDGNATTTASGNNATMAESGTNANAAATGTGDNAVPVDEIIALSEWQMDDAYTNGISVDRIMDDSEVYGPTGDEIGSIENVVFSQDGKVLSVIAEVGGFWDMFDTHVSVPWDQLSWDGMDRITIPVTEENVEDYSVFKSDYLTASAAQEGVEVVNDDLRTGQSAFRASDLLGDYSRIRQDGELVNYGYVNDLIIKDGSLQTVVVTPDTSYGVSGPYAYPYYRQGWTPTQPYYDMPYDTAEAVEANQVDYDRFQTN